MTRRAAPEQDGRMNTLEHQIMQALADNPRVAPEEISVQAVGGDVTLRGTVGSLVERAEAVRAAGQVPGVESVVDSLGVRLATAEARADADTKAAVLDALNADDDVRAADIDVAVRDGAVTLSGWVDFASQRDRADRVALAVPGVAGVHNRMRLAFPVAADEVAARITDAIGPNAIVGADSVRVTVRDDIVTLSGTVRSSGDHDVALAAAAAAPGVVDVRDEIRVQS
jgi:osmotically-inducible protein OsmY